MNTNHIRNFAIIAHVDHGKSTLADRLLEITGAVPKIQMREQFLDQNPISRERGITIKLAPVRMNYTLDATNYALNLIDTPGHVDFSYEVSRTLAACEGVILLVDATQGVQAQTVAHFQAAKKENLVMIPVVNKIDMANARKELVAKELVENFGFKKEEIIYISAKTGENVEMVLKEVVRKIPPPSSSSSLLRALVFDAVYDGHRGVVVFVRVTDGTVRPKDLIRFMQSDATTTVTEVGFFAPKLSPKNELSAGEIGYIITGIKDIHKTQVGDTVTLSKIKEQRSKIEPLPGYKRPKPMVFFGVYPKNTDDLILLKKTLEKLTLIDSSLTISEEYSAFLGSGFRVGFLGLLHAEIIRERIRQEAGIDPLFTQPRVLFNKTPEGDLLEPFMRLSIYVPHQYVGVVMQLCQQRKGILIDALYKETYVLLIYEMPYSMFIRGLSSDLKSVSEGFASLDYELVDFRKADLVNLETRVNDRPIDVLSEFVYRDEASRKASEKVEKLKETLPRQQFRQVIQGVVSGQIVARAEIAPFRKDVIKKLSGGDRTRKDKLLEKQKKGKARLMGTSKVDIPQEALFSFLKDS